MRFTHVEHANDSFHKWHAIAQSFRRDSRSGGASNVNEMQFAWQPTNLRSGHFTLPATDAEAACQTDTYSEEMIRHDTDDPTADAES